MSNFSPLAASRAVAFVEAAGIANARRLIADFAAMGMVKSYALAMERTPVGGTRTQLPRDTTVPVEHWRRIIRDGLVDEVWTGGTVRLAPGELVGGEDEVWITGIRFSDAHLQRLVNDQLGIVPEATRSITSPEAPVEMAREAPAPAAPAQLRQRPDASAIPSGAIAATIQQTMTATGYGRTKINELLKEGRLVRASGAGRAVRIEVASIYAFLGFSA